MEIATTTEFQTLFPNFVMHKHWDMPKEFNERLAELAREDALAHRVTDADNPLAVGGSGNHIAHMRHNFLTETIDPAMVTFTNMVSYAVREFLWHGFHYAHDGEIRMMSDVFYQRRSHDENTGIPTHAHYPHEIICTYYPSLPLDEDCPDTPLKRGGLRFYDPSFRSTRLWPMNHPEHHTRPTYMVEPREGSMVVFEGHIPHDSTYFEGDERVCIPILCQLDLPNSHIRSTIAEIMEVQNGL